MTGRFVPLCTLVIALACLVTAAVACGPSAESPTVAIQPPTPTAVHSPSPLPTYTPTLLLSTSTPATVAPVGAVESPSPTLTGPATLAPEASATTDPYAEARKRMVLYQMMARGIADQKVLAVMEKVPRHEFVPSDVVGQAYADHPLPIGYGQTISQPYIVAFMTELLGVEPHHRVLEIGTGSGYQAAVLAELTDEVYTVEIIAELAESAAERLRRLGYTTVRTQNGDGYYGWEEYAPFDAIIVTAAPDHVPQPLVRQLKDGGRLVIPVGPPGGYQSLWLITKQGEEIISRNVLGVRFVPLTGEH